MKKEELTFAERTAVLTLSGLSSTKVTDAVSAAIRTVSVAEAISEGVPAESAASLASRMFRKTIADMERKVVKALLEKEAIREGEDVTALEIANGRDRAFIPDGELFESLIAPLEEALKEGKPAEEDKATLWLLREAGTLPYVFTPAELEGIGEKMEGFPAWGLMFGKKLELGGRKRRVGEMPVSDRKDGVFIENIFLPEGDEREALMKLLRERGHEAGTVEEGQRPLIRIDGILYRADMDARKIGRLPIEGISLRPAFL